MMAGETNIYYVTEEESLKNPGQTTGLGWYFRNEIEDLYGPYNTEQAAHEAFVKYCKEELGDD